MKIFLKVFVLVVLAAVFCGCGGGGGGGGETPTVTLLDADGTEVTEIDVSTPLATKVTGLSANTQYIIQTLDPDGNVVCEVEVYSDGDGIIPESHYCFLRESDAEGFTEEARVDTETSLLPFEDDDVSGYFSVGKAVVIGNWTYRVKTRTGTLLLSYAVPVTSSRASVCASNSQGKCARSFLQDYSNVYVTIGEGPEIANGKQVDIYIINDRCQMAYVYGDELVPVTSLSVLNATINYVNRVYTTTMPVWLKPAYIGKYDIVVDVDRSGTFTAGDIVEILDQKVAGPTGLCASGFGVQSAYDTGTDVVLQIAMDKNRSYQDVFSAADYSAFKSDVFAAAESLQRIGYSATVNKYVVAHKNTWTSGDVLTDIIPRTRDAVQRGCTWQSMRLVAPINLLPAGCYDIVMDVNGNGVYDRGIDAVDNINLGGITSCGFRVVGTTSDFGLTIDTITDSSGTNVKNGSSNALLSPLTIAGQLSGTTSGAEISAYATNGSQASSIVSTTMTGNGAYTLQGLPMFAGSNTIIVYASEASGTSAETRATVSWQPGGETTTADISMSLTWTNIASDLDLHVIKPGGTYAAAGGSFANKSDCHWQNECQLLTCDATHGCLVVPGNMGLDWSVAAGQAASADAGYVAKLDRDCYECSDRYESFTLRSASQVNPSTGKYLVCAYIAKGSDRPTLKVNIKGYQVTAITGPSMYESSASRTWVVGYVKWTAGGGQWVNVSKLGNDAQCDPTLY